MPRVPEPEADLPLRSFTPDSWAQAVLRDPFALLNDHAHLEKKAANNAMDLLGRWPETDPPEHWAAAMTAIARDETEHLAAVTKLLYRRGGRLTKHHANPYAAALRQLVRKGGPAELADRLIVSALIEARSCERFQVLSRHCEDPQLQKLYRGLWSSEHGHYLVFLDLAKRVRPTAEIERRWDECLEAEAAIMASQPTGPRMHSGCEQH